MAVAELAPTLRVGGRADGAGSSSDNTPLVPAQLADPIIAGEQRTYTHGGRGFRMRNVVPDRYDGMGVRRLTPLECERLQGFPDGWTAVGCQGEKISDSRRYAGLGNAVPPPFVYWIAERLKAATYPEGTA